MIDFMKYSERHTYNERSLRDCGFLNAFLKQFHKIYKYFNIYPFMSKLRKVRHITVYDYYDYFIYNS